MQQQSGKTFAKVRADHATETAEDYVEAVSEILKRTGKCRVTDLADFMGVSHVTVVRIITRLQEEQLVETEPYRPILLTDKGEHLAVESRRRHKIVLDFLKVIGVPEKEAIHDSEGIEHHVGNVTLDKMEEFVRKQGGVLET